MLKAKRFFDIVREEYIPGQGPGAKGSAYVDILAFKNGRTLYIQVGKQTKVKKRPVVHC